MDGAWKRAIPEREIRSLAADIDRQGFGFIENYFSNEELAGIRELAEAKVHAAGGEYVALVGSGAASGTLLGELPRSHQFQGLCHQLFELGTGEKARGMDFAQVLRCLQGSSGLTNSNRFHYDSYILTVIIAIVIPETGKQGDLVLFGSPRAIRRSYIVNLFDKIMVDNPLTQWILRGVLRYGLPGPVRIHLRPGNAYFIWGYRSLHTNEPCDGDKLRATAIFHYGDPHRDSNARKALRSVITRLRFSPGHNY